MKPKISPSIQKQLIHDLSIYYEIDIHNCIMTNAMWIETLATAMLNKDTLSEFYWDYTKYLETHSE